MLLSRLHFQTGVTGSHCIGVESLEKSKVGSGCLTAGYQSSSSKNNFLHGNGATIPAPD